MSSKKEACPDCGSKDNLVTWDNGSSYCFSNGCPGNEHRVSTLNITPFAIENRGIREDTCAKYGVGKGPDGHLWAPYYKDGKPVAYKVRTPDKKFYFNGDAAKATLFGLQCCSGDRRIIITEGELDALAAYQMTGYPAVSLANGASSVSKSIKPNLEFLESYEYVYVAVDMDEPGRKAGQEILELLKPGKGLLVTLPEGFKDACDMLGARKDKEFKQALYAARPIKVEGVLDDAELVERAMALYTNESKRRGPSTGFESLDYLLGGLRPGEVSVFVGGTGVGKTAIVRQLTVNLITEGHKVLYIPLEMPAEVVLLQMTEMIMGGSLITNPEFKPETVSTEVTDIASRVKFYDHFGTIDPIKLVNAIEYVCRIHDTKFVVLDHISAVATCAEDERKAVDAAISGLKSVALRLGVHVLVVSHKSRDSNDKDDNNPTLATIRYSQSIAQYADQVIGVIRSRDSNKATLRTLKVSRLWGQYGESYLVWENYHFKEEEGRKGYGSSNHSVNTRDSSVDYDFGYPESGEGEDEVNGPSVLDVEPTETELGTASDVGLWTLVDTVELGPCGEDGLDETSQEQTGEQSRGKGRVSQRPGKGSVSSKRTDEAQYGSSTVSVTDEEVHARLPVSVREPEASDDRGEGSPDSRGENEVQISPGQLRPDSESSGSGGSGTGFRLSAGKWSFESQEP